MNMAPLSRNGLANAVVDRNASLQNQGSPSRFS